MTWVEDVRTWEDTGQRTWTRALAQAEIQAKKLDYELEGNQVQLERQAERVRKALLYKEQKIRQAKEQEFKAAQAKQARRQRRNRRGNNNGNDYMDTGVSENMDVLLNEVWYIEDNDSPQRYEELQTLRAEERMLQEASQRLESVAAMLLDKAARLRERALELESQRSGRGSW